MSYKYNDPLHHVIGNALNDGCKNWGVESGLAVSEHSTGADMYVDVASGVCFVDGVAYTETGITNVAIASADSTYPRRDLIIYDTSAGSPGKVTGTAAATPIPPDIPSGDILLAVVDVPANDTTITNDQIHDGRVFVRSLYATRELWCPATFGTDGIGVASNSVHVGVIMTDGAQRIGYATFKVPEDFVSDGVLKAVVLPGATGNIYYDIYAHWAADGYTAGESAHQSDVVEAVTDDCVEILNTSVSMVNLAKGDVVGGRFIRDANNVDDTVDGVVHFLGLIFEYTAEI